MEVTNTQQVAGSNLRLAPNAGMAPIAPNAAVSSKDGV
jgi:hypothetical protein